MSRRSREEPDEIKYAPGVGARVPPSQRPLRPLDWVVVIHVLVFLVGTTWGFGGMIYWIKPILSWWGSLGLLITLTAMQDRDNWRDGGMRPLLWFIPLLVFNGLVLVSCLNVNMLELHYDTGIQLARDGGNPGMPSTAKPEVSLRALWLFDAIWASCINLALIIRQRRILRGILVVAAINAFVLAVFGTAQKFSHAKGLYFDAVPSPQIYFFSTFVYHNHWGAFIVLTSAASLGLIWHYVRRKEARDFFHTPAFGGVIGLLIAAATVPLSTSRSCTVLMTLLLGGAFVHWCLRVIEKRRRFRESVAPPLLGGIAAVVLGLAGVWYVARDSITMRIARTQEQVADMRAKGNMGARPVLYRDTWRMAKDKPWFGWGMGSYPWVFETYKSIESVDGLPVFYHDAHSDWLQSFAEHGFVGTAVLGLCGIVPLLSLRRRHFSSPFSVYLMAGCGLVLLYAWLEFPFGNVAVVLSWWICYFCAVQYARLQDREAPSPVKIVGRDEPPAGEIQPAAS